MDLSQNLSPMLFQQALLCISITNSSSAPLSVLTKKHSKIVHVLQNNPKCAFELAPNEPPYYGVRGNGLASMHEDGAAELLERLIKRYLGSTDSKIAQKLLQQSEHEIAIMIEPGSITSWDYRQRMSD